jgi:hypothetical protein
MTNTDRAIFFCCYTVKPGTHITRIYHLIIYTLRQKLRATCIFFYFLRMKEIEADMLFS